MKNRLALAAAFVALAALLSRTHIRDLLAGEEAAELPAATLETLPSPAGPGSAEPNLDAGPDGRVHMSWLEPLASGQGHALKVATLEGKEWTEPQSVRSGRDFFVNWADFPSVVDLGDGRLASHWLQRTGTATYAYGVRLAFSSDGGRTWSVPLTPHTDSSNTEHGFVSLWRAGRGGVEAVWLDGRKYNPGVRDPSNEMSLATAAFTFDGAVSAAERILDGRVCDCCQTSVAMASNGPVVVYRDRSADEIRDIAVVRRTTDGRWTEPVPVHVDGWKINACPVNGPSIAARGDNVAVAWFTAANNAPMVQVAFSRDGGASFSRPIRVDEGQPAGRVDVELTRDGDALVTWIERAGGDAAAVRLRRVERRGRAGAPTTIAASSAARASGFPRMVVAGNDAVFAWTLPGRPSEVKVARMKVQ